MSDVRLQQAAAAVKGTFLTVKFCHIFKKRKPISLLNGQPCKKNLS